MTKYDYLLLNGHVIDPENGINEVMDIAVQDGKIARIDKCLENQAATSILDLSGLYVTPGLIDAHVHCYYNTGVQKSWTGDYSIQPDLINLSQGVTTMIDAGSSGSYNFDHFRSTVINRSKTKIYALLNITDLGMTSLRDEQYPLENDFQSFISCYQRNKDRIVGIKIAHYDGKDFNDIDYAKKIQEEIQIPIMVDFGVFKKERPYDELLLSKLRRGDITTHCFRGPVPILDTEGYVYDYLREAQKKGIIFDVGHGAGSFLFRNAIPAVQQNFLPDILSTDLHVLSYRYTSGMSDLLSKFMSIDNTKFYDYIRMTTEIPKKVFGLKNCGNISVKSEADIAVWNLRKGIFSYQDTGGGRLDSDICLECEMTFIQGEVCFDRNARTSKRYDKLDENYGYNPMKEQKIIPQFKVIKNEHL
ncbi:MAG: amidohydrolase/deacetylase family metallohydrolase [Anaerorhabdus sp.]|uniref:amidohydrolase/deacetylase family metallohydrolase n=1 Tax=Anaerorhabdus sp. TaxID=1872524 RepID=UPI002FC736B0